MRKGSTRVRNGSEELLFEESKIKRCKDNVMVAESRAQNEW